MSKVGMGGLLGTNKLWDIARCLFWQAGVAGVASVAGGDKAIVQSAPIVQIKCPLAYQQPTTSTDERTATSFPITAQKRQLHGKRVFYDALIDTDYRIESTALKLWIFSCYTHPSELFVLGSVFAPGFCCWWDVCFSY